MQRQQLAQFFFKFWEKTGIYVRNGLAGWHAEIREASTARTNCLYSEDYGLRGGGSLQSRYVWISKTGLLLLVFFPNLEVNGGPVLLSYNFCPIFLLCYPVGGGKEWRDWYYTYDSHTIVY
jgi:hypothetical protein